MPTATMTKAPTIIVDKAAMEGTCLASTVQDIPRPDAAYARAEGAYMEYFVQVDGKKYKVKVDENGTPISIGRYNEKHKMYITLKFSEVENPDCEQAVLALLKSSYINRMVGVLSA